MNLVVGAEGAVDPTELTCVGCRYRSGADVCKRFPPIFIPSHPPIFIPSHPVNSPQGPVLVEARWAFPPAVSKCGEWRRPEE